jgi:cytochrome c biogenesis protein CcmG, thiol:disulfide interchange protein DsbE
MRPALFGVLAGLLVSAAVLAGVLALLPEEPLGPLPSAVATASARPSATVSAPVPTATGSVGPSGSAAASSPPVGLAVGDQAPPLVVEQLGGGEMDLAGLRGEPVWINFTASYCPPCRDELPLMERIGGQLGGRLTILVVDVREDEDTVASLASQLSLTLPIGLDQDGTAQQAWGAFALPVHYWVDEDGRVAAYVYGGPGPDEFIEGIHAVLPDAEIDL